ncbi:hypothetical protein F7725_007985, partial [Dissostichus mawsoni]
YVHQDVETEAPQCRGTCLLLHGYSSHLHFALLLLIPTIFPNADTSLTGSTTLHTVVFLFLMFNALGNYIMTITYPAESANEIVVPVCSAHCSDKVDAHYLLNGRHFCKLCKKVILKRDHHCFFTGNCIGNKNMRYFIMFCIYTSCTCLYSLVLGVAFLTVEYSISFENPLTFLTLLPLSTGYFFTGAAGGPGADLVSDAEGAAGGEPQPLEIQPKGRVWNPLDPWPYPTCADCGDVL